jgi:hypothetical protein
LAVGGLLFAQEVLLFSHSLLHKKCDTL